jgi:MYXO-CTERM domain-containing protein
VKSLRRKPASIAKTRWTAYAVAGATTALVGSNSAEAAIHYSGILNEKFPAHRNRSETFQLMGQPGRSLRFVHSNHPPYGGSARLGVVGAFLVSFGGFSVGSSDRYVSKLRFGQNISSGEFWPYESGIMAAGSSTYWAWAERGTGYAAFRFNSGSGLQYGWIRVTMAGPPLNGFLVSAYAYADPGEPIRAGQRSSAEQAPDEGSLGWLALGAVGLLAWRRIRSHNSKECSYED